MKSKTFNQFVALQSKDGNLIELSKYKRELPEEYETYNTAYKRALEEVKKLHNRNVAGYTGFDFMKKENILKQLAGDKTIPHPDKTFEESKAIEARNQRIREGNYTSADFEAAKSEYIGRGIR